MGRRWKRRKAFPLVPEIGQGLICQQHLLPPPASQLLLGSKQREKTTLSQVVLKKMCHLHVCMW